LRRQAQRSVVGSPYRINAQYRAQSVEWLLAQHLIRLSPPPGVLQNDAAPMTIDDLPFFDLFQGSKAAEARKVIAQAAISYARGLSGAVDITH
jgi:hypothetical protein